MGRLVLNLRLCLAITIAMTGCYGPDISKCFLACGANNACPSELACNSQGLCASSSSEMCSDMPLDDAQMDSPLGDLTTVTFDVLAPDGTGQDGVRIVFSTPSGAMISETTTSSTGHAVAANIPVGSSATIIRVNGSSYGATTYLDLWEDAQIVSRFGQVAGSRQVTVNWQPPSTVPTGGNYSVYTTCFTAEQVTSQNTVTLNVTDNCRRFDVFVVLKSSGGSAVGVAAVPNVDGLSAVNITQTMWQTLDNSNSIDALLMNLPAGNAELQFSGYLTPAFAYTTPAVKTNVPPSGDAPALFFPTKIGATAALNSTTVIGGDNYRQLYVERLPANTTTYERDFATRKFPWFNLATLDIPTKTLSWPIITTNGIVFISPSISYVRLAFRRGGDDHEWHIIGRGNHISATTTMGTYVLPEIPGDNPFEPETTDTGFTDEISYFSVTPGVEDDVRAHLESHDVGLDIFGITGLTYVLRATAF